MAKWTAAGIPDLGGQVFVVTGILWQSDVVADPERLETSPLRVPSQFSEFDD